MLAHTHKHLYKHVHKFEYTYMHVTCISLTCTQERCALSPVFSGGHKKNLIKGKSDGVNSNKNNNNSKKKKKKFFLEHWIMSAANYSSNCWLFKIFYVVAREILLEKKGRNDLLVVVRGKNNGSGSG